MPLSAWTNTQVIDVLNTGLLWQNPTITYAFPTVTSGLSDDGDNNYVASFSALTGQQQAVATIAIGLWDDLIVNDLMLTTALNSNIEFANFYDGTFADYALAHLPFEIGTLSNGGTVWLNSAHDGSFSEPVNNADNNLVNPYRGGHGFATYIHEVGHAFGLDHPGDTVTPSNFRDSTVYTIMSYFGPSWGAATGAPNDVAWADWVGSDGLLYEPQTPMIDDILAMQTMYGAEITTRLGDTIYGFNSNLTTVYAGIYDFVQNLNPIMCLYDAGGIDTLDLSGWNTVSNVNLNAGAFSSANSMTNNISIAHSAVIENARTGDGADTLTGNSASNVLNGGAGTDILYGDLGNDTLIGGTGADQLNGGGGIDTASYVGSLAGVTVHLGLTTAQVSGGDASGDVLTAIVNLIGSSQGDTLTGNATANDLNGGLGDDTLIGGAGADQLNGGGGTDTASYVGSGASVTVNLNVSTAQISNGDASGDVLTAISNVVGSSNNDTLTGNSAANLLNGGLGEDTLFGGAGADQLIGGGGIDTASYVGSLAGVTVNLGLATAQVSSGDASGDVLTAISNVVGSSNGDTLTGNGAANLLNGGLGEDTLIGGAGADQLNGAEGNDTITGQAGADDMDGGAGRDELSYYDSVQAVTVNTVTGTSSGGDGTGDVFRNFEVIQGSNFGGDTFYGNGLENTLNGNGGNDVLFGGGGSDILSGGAHDDVIIGQAGADDMDGGDGKDALSYYDSALAVTVNLVTGTSSGGHGTGDVFRNFEIIHGSNLGGDTFYGNGLENTISGHGGNDVLFGGAGNDVLSGGAHDDVIIGQAGADDMDGGAGNDELSYYDSALAVTVNVVTGTTSGGDGTGDTFRNFEIIHGSNSGGDTFYGNGLVNILSGHGGNDVLFGGAGNDILNGGAHDDVIIGQAGADDMDGGAGKDALSYYDSALAVTVNMVTGTSSGGDGTGDTFRDFEIIHGSNYGSDTLYGNGLENTLSGHGGSDRIDGGAGNDILGGGSGADTFVFSGAAIGNDIIVDYLDGVDKIEFSAIAGLDFSDLAFTGQGSYSATVSGFGGASLLTINSAVAINLDISDFLFT